MQERNEWKYVQMFSQWYSWGSPIGLSLFFINMAITFFIVVAAVNMIHSCNQYKNPVLSASGQVE